MKTISFHPESSLSSINTLHNDRYFKKCITFGRAKEGLRADFQEQLKDMQNEIGFEYVRFHGLFHDDMAVYDEDQDGNPVLWFGYIDKLFDFLLSVHIKPFVELGFMPIQLATVPNTVFWWKANGCPPTDYQKWAFLVSGTVHHLIQRYGLDEVKTWYFEVWNEPNLSSFFRGTQEDYFKLYKTTVDAVKSICPELRVGGPSTSGADFREGLGYLKDFIRFCSSENLPIDFFSAHPYPTCWALDGDGTQKMGYISKDICIDFLNHIRSIVNDSPYAGAEIHLTEWNSSPSPRDLIHDTPFMAPYILYNITHGYHKVDSLAFWTFTDVFEENGPGLIPFHGGFGLINVDHVKKPAYWAYWMLNQLGDDIIAVNDHFIITKQDDEYRIIIWNYCYYTDTFAAGDRSQLTETSRDGVFELEDLRFEIKLDDQYRAAIYTLDESTSAYHHWLKAGAPKYPDSKTIAYIRNESTPSKQECILSGIQETLAPHEVKLFILHRQ